MDKPEMIKVQCQYCGKIFSVKKIFAGRRAQCSRCAKIIQIPVALEPEAAGETAPIPEAQRPPRISYRRESYLKSHKKELLISLGVIILVVALAIMIWPSRPAPEAPTVECAKPIIEMYYQNMNAKKFKDNYERELFTINNRHIVPYDKYSVYMSQMVSEKVRLEVSEIFTLKTMRDGDITHELPIKLKIISLDNACEPGYNAMTWLYVEREYSGKWYASPSVMVYALFKSLNYKPENYSDFR